MSQSEKLMKIANGVTNFCTEMRSYLENTKESFDRVLNTNYHVNTAPIITKTLEQEYEDILATNEDYEYVSAVGYKAILKNGDTVRVTGNSGHFFLNGERMTADYTYTGDGCEMVSVWVFETVGSAIVVPPTLNDTPSFTPYEIIIKNIGQLPVINKWYLNYVSKITTDNFKLQGTFVGCKVLVVNGMETFNQYVPLNIKEIYSDCITLKSGFSGMTNPSNLGNVSKFSLTNCKTINTYGTFDALSSIDEWVFGQLTTLKNDGINAPMFKGARLVYIPNTVKTVSASICSENTTVRLECNEANSIHNDWCKGTPTNFSMVKDWKSSINIAVAAKNWVKDKFIDLFENYLFDLSVVGDDGTLYAEREITIPKAIYDTLTDEEFAIAENKGWIVGGA